MELVKFDKGTHFEERLVQALLVDHAFAEQMIEVLQAEYFQSEHLKEVARTLFEFYAQFRSFPSMKTFLLVVKQREISDVLKEKVFQYIVKIKKEPLNGDMDYIKEQALDFCRKQALANALDNALDLMKDKKYESIVHEIQKALAKGTERDVGHMFNEEAFFEQRMTEVKRTPVPTPWMEINSVLRGGPSEGNICVVMASTGVGKSHCLVDIGSHAIMSGLTVVHYTLELSDVDVANRYDARITGIPIDDLKDHKDEVRKLETDRINGHLIVKSYPTKSITAMTIKNHLSKLALKEDKRPDLIIVDYADLMRSSRKYEDKRFEEESIYEELRSLAQELGIPIWTATQSNRSGIDEEVLTLKHIAECFNKAMISDLFITMSRKKDNTDTTVGNFFIAKSRLGSDGVKFPILVNTATSTIKVLPSVAPEGEEDESDRLRKRFIDFMQGQGEMAQNVGL